MLSLLEMLGKFGALRTSKSPRLRMKSKLNQLGSVALQQHHPLMLPPNFLLKGQMSPAKLNKTNKRLLQLCLEVFLPTLRKIPAKRRFSKSLSNLSSSSLPSHLLSTIYLTLAVHPLLPFRHSLSKMCSETCYQGLASSLLRLRLSLFSLKFPLIDRTRS